VSRTPANLRFFSHFIQAKDRIVPQIRSEPLPSAPIFSLLFTLIQSFNAVLSELLTVSLSKLQINVSYISASRVVSLPITVASWFKTSTVFARSNIGIVDSNPTLGMDVCVRLFCVCAVLCAGSGLATG
jgi:hypothetical protein